MTEQLRKIFKRYGVELRTCEQKVVHASTGQMTMLNPIQFGVYDAHIKAEYCLRILQGNITQQVVDWYAMLLAKNDILPCSIKVTGKQAENDRWYCTRHIQKAGQYYELLD